MAVAEIQNRSQLFYATGTLVAAFKNFTLKSQARNLKIKLSAGGSDSCEFNLIGGGGASAKVEGKIGDGESETFTDLDFDKVAVRGTGTVRVWAW